MKNFKFLFILVAAATLASCASLQMKDKQLAQIDSILIQVDSIEQIVNGISFDSISNLAKDMADDKKQIKKYYHSDTVDENLARKINRFNGIRKQFKKVSSKGIMFNKKITLMQEQLQSLKIDVENGAGNKEKYNEYILLEQSNFNDLEKEFKDIYTVTQDNLKEHQEIMPFVKSFIEDIKKID